MADGVRGLLAPWMGGAGSPSAGAGARGMLAFWMGGAANGNAIQSQEQFSGGYFPRTRVKTKEEIRKERIALGIIKPEVIEALPEPVQVRARKAGTIKVADLIGPRIASMDAEDIETFVQRAKKRRRRQDEELLLM